jgi:hypothetical protein
MVCFRGNYRRNELIFLLVFSVSKSIGNNIFYYQWTFDRQKITNERVTNVGDFIRNIFTNIMVVQIPTENFISKSKNCGSGLMVLVIHTL